MGLEFLITFLIAILVIGVILWGIRYIGLPDPIYKIAVVVAVIVIILWLVRSLGYVSF